MTNNLNDLLTDGDLKSFNHRYLILQDEFSNLEKLSEIVDQEQKNNFNIQDLHKKITTNEASNELLERQLEETQTQLILVEKDINHLEKQLLLEQKIHNLEEERKKLLPDTPCPLCGSKNHPFINYVLHSNNTQFELDEFKKSQNNLYKKYNQLNLDITSTKSKIDQNKEQLITKQLESKQNIQKLKTIANFFQEFINDNLIGELPKLMDLIKIKSYDNVKQKEVIKNKIDKIDQVSKDKHNYEEQLIPYNKELESLEKNLIRINTQIDTWKKTHNQSTIKLDEFNNNITSITNKLNKDLLKHGIESVNEDSIKEIKQQLLSKSQTWQDQQNKYNHLNTEIKDIQNELKTNKLLMDKFNNEKSKYEQKLNTLNEQHEKLQIQRFEIYADKNPDTEEKKILSVLEALEKKYTDTNDKNTQSKIRLETTNNKKIATLNFIDNLLPKLNDLEQQFSDNLAQFNFANETDFLNKILTKQDRDELQQQSDNLKITLADLEKEHIKVNTRLSEITTNELPNNSLLEIGALLDHKDKQISNIEQNIGGIKLQLNEDLILREKQSDILIRQNSQRQELENWNNLHALIGSADGKKFRIFAQGLTFELVVKHANQQLREMTDRYLLIRDKEKPLDLNIIDNYQGGEIRSIKNLSGGEGFIVSLALALGLSKMASNKIQVDSLFLDEGFGTLDEDSLQIVLDALNNLHQKGKLIGVISHVMLLKHLISTQINIEKINGGVSRLSGIGCKKL